MARYEIQGLSVGDAGLTSRPSVVDTANNRVIKIYRRTEVQAAERVATVLNEIQRRHGLVTTAGLRLRAKICDWGFDPRPVVKALSLSTGDVTELSDAFTRTTYWQITPPAKPKGDYS